MDRYHFLDEDLLNNNDEEYNPEEDEVIYEYISLLRKQGINFPKEDPLGYKWTTEKLMKYIKEHTER
jgi:hypothetical protein